MTSPKSPALPSARLAGLLSLTTLAAGMFAEFFVVDALIVPGDAAATAGNIRTSESLYRLGLAANLIDYTFYLAASFIFFSVFKPVDRTLSLFAATFSLVATAIVAGSAVYYLAPLFFLGDAPHLAAFGTDRLQALAYLPHRLRSIGANLAMVFFGLHLLFVGWLIVGSTFLPRVLGVLTAIGGICFLINSFAHFLAPAFAAQLLPYILLPGVAGQASLALWLLAMGVNAARWREQAGAA